jgi:hypothetical protein
LARFESAAAWLGVVTGLWSFVAAYSGEAGNFGLLTLTVAVLLAIVSFFCMVGPKKAFYISAILALALAGSMLLGTGLNLTAYLTLGLALVDFGVDVVAARREVGVSEQANPMNLPVFG